MIRKVTIAVFALLCCSQAWGQDSLNVRSVGFLINGNRLANSVAVEGNYAYISDSRGLRVVNVENPASPTQASYFDFDFGTRGVAVSGGYAYLANESEGLRILDVTNPAIPEEVGFYEMPGYPEDVVVSGDYAYVTDTNYGLRVIDVSVPSSPSEVGLNDLPECAVGVDISGDYVFVTNTNECGVDSGSLWIMYVSNPSQPVVVGSLYTQGDAVRVAASGDYAYLADGRGDLRVIDASDHAAPVEIAFLETPGWVTDVVVYGSYVAVADYIGGLRIVDMTNPAVPQEAGFYQGIGAAIGVAVQDGFAYVAAGPEFVIYDISAALPAIDSRLTLPQTVALHSAYPNPFNPVTTIAFDLPETGNVELKVFNMLGQSVAELINRPMPAGTHTVEFDARGLASGSYFYTLNTGSQVLTRKMVLIK